MIGETEADNAYFQQIAEGTDQGTISFKENGEEKAISYVTNPTTDWIVGGKIKKKISKNWLSLSYFLSREHSSLRYLLLYLSL